MTEKPNTKNLPAGTGSRAAPKRGLGVVQYSLLGAPLRQTLSLDSEPNRLGNAKITTDEYISGRVNFSSVRNPSSKGMFGAVIDDQDLLFAVKREPAGFRIVFMVAADVFDKWFNIEEIDATGKPVDNSTLDAEVQKELSRLRAKPFFTLLYAMERCFGWSILLKGYLDEGANLKAPVDNAKSIRDLAVYSPLGIERVNDVTNPEDERYGYPLTYEIATSSLPEPVHYSRVIHCATRLIDHKYKGQSALSPVYDDLMGFRYMRWGSYMAMIRYGSGFPDVLLKGATPKKIQEYIDRGEFDDMNSRKYFVHNETTAIEFKGVGSTSSLNPQNYYPIGLESIATGTGIPEPMLKGAQAGALTGSEENTRAYFKLISDCQTSIEPYVKALIDELISFIRTNNLPAGYKLKWKAGFELTEKEKADVNYTKASTAEKELWFKTIDEVRKDNYSMKELPGGEGTVCLGVAKAKAPAPSEGGGFGGSQAFSLETRGHSIDASDQEDLQSKLAENLKKILAQFLKNELTEDEAVLSASLLIEAHITSMKKIAKLSIENKLNRQIGELPPEQNQAFLAMRNQMVADFKRVLRDAAKGQPNATPGAAA